ncbi:MAG: LEPR-XLL domain-containing protein [Desulfobacterales bacterium]
MGLARNLRRLARKKQAAAAKVYRRKAVIEPLEPRLLLSADLSYSMGGGVNDLTLALNQVDGVDTLQLINNDDADPTTQIVAAQAFSETTGVRIFGSESDDAVTIDMTDPFDIPVFFTDTTADRDVLEFTGDGDRTWNITGPNTGETGNVSFSGIENLTGAADNSDKFVFLDGGALTGSITGGSGGTDTLDFAFVTEDLTFSIGAGGAISVTGWVGGSISASGMESLIGGMGSDLFDFGTGEILVGTIDGGTAGSDTLDYSDYTSDVSVNLFAGTATGTSGISNIDNIVGGAGDDTLTGGTGNNVISGGTGADTIAGGTGEDTITGGSGNDTFLFSDGWGSDVITDSSGSDVLDFSAVEANLTYTIHVGGAVSVTDGVNTLDNAAGMERIVGGKGDNTFVFEDGAVFVGTIDGGTGGINTLDYSAYTSGITVDLSSGTAPGTSGISNIRNVIGGAGADTLKGDENANELTGGAGDDDITGGGGNDILDGGEGSDTFHFSGAWGEDSIWDGGVTGTDTLDFSAVSADLTFTINANASISVLSGTNQLEETGGIEAVEGGSGDNRFVFEEGGSIDGTIDGGTGGTNTLDYSAYTSPVTVDLSAGTATGTLGISHFVNVTGGSGNDAISGDANANVLDGGAGNDLLAGGLGADTLIGGEGDDILAGGGEGDSLAGGAGDDIYVVTGGTQSITEAADAGFDTLAYDNHTGGGVAVSLGSTTPTATDVTGDIGNIESVLGGPESDTFEGTDFDDTFYFVNNWGLDTATDESDTDSDTLDFSAVTKAMTFTFAAGAVTVTEGTNSATGTKIENVIGGSSDDVFVFDDGWGNYTIISGGTIDEDILDFSAVGMDLTFTLHEDGTVSVTDGTNTLGASAGIENIIGGSATNTFVFEDQGGMDGYIEGAGTNILDYSAYTTTVFLDLSTMDVLYEGLVNGVLTQSYGVAYTTGLKGANNITGIIGGSSANDLLIGPQQDSVWSIDGPNSGTLNTTFEFSEIENITGSADFDDSFTVTAAGSLSGTLSGNAYGLVSSATHLEIPMSLAGVAEGTDTLTFSGGSYTDVTFTAVSADAGVIERDSDKLRFAGFESVVDNSAAENRTFTYPADATARITLGGGVGTGQSWSIEVDGVSYTHTAGESDDLEDVVAGLASQIAAGDYLTIVQDLSILITKTTGGAPVVVADLPVTGFASVEAPTTTDVSLRISEDGAGKLNITPENGEFTPFSFAEPSGHVYVNTGKGDDTITVEQFAITAALAIDGKDGTDSIVFEVQAGSSTKSVSFGTGTTGTTNFNGSTAFTYAHVEEANHLVVKATDGNDQISLSPSGSGYSVSSSNGTFGAVTFNSAIDSLTIDAKKGVDELTLNVGSSTSFSPSLTILADDTENSTADNDVLHLGSGSYASLRFGADWETVDGTGSVVDLVFDARPSIANRVHVFRDYSDNITIVDETDIGTTITSIKDPTGSLTINTGYNAPYTTEYIHIGEDPDNDVRAWGNLNFDLIIDAGTLNKNLDGEDSVTIFGDLTLTGHQLDITSENITINSGVTVSTSYASGTAGDINLTGFHITVGTGARLLAEGSDTEHSGDITIEAMDESALVTPLVDVDVSNVDVTISTDAVIRGRDVTILASADNRRLYAEDGTLTGTAADLLGSLFESLTSIGGAIAVVVGDASIDIAAGSEITARNFKADASVYADVKAVPFLEFGVAPSIGVAVTDAEVNVAGTITATGNAEFRTHTDHSMNVVADTSAIKGISAAIAVSVIVSDANTIISDTALLNIGGDLYVTADTVDRNRTMARSGAGKDGTVALAVAVTVEDGDTNAFLDGEANVAGNVTVKADQLGIDLPISKLYVIPSLGIGTSAQAGVGATSKGDFLDDAKATATGSVITKFKNALAPFIAKAQEKITGTGATYGPEPPADFGSKFDLAGAVAVLVDNNRTISRIGVSPTHTTEAAEPVAIDPGGLVAVTETHTAGGVAGSWYRYIGTEPLSDVSLGAEDFTVTSRWELFEHPHVVAGGFIEVLSTAATAPYVSANASAQNNSDTAGSQNTSEISGAMAISVGILNNIADAYINTNAVVDAAETLTIQAQALSDYTWAWGINLVQALTEQATYTVEDPSDDGEPNGGLSIWGAPDTTIAEFPVDIESGDTVEVEYNHTGTGIAGTWYEAKGALTGVNLVTEDFGDTTKWDVVETTVGDPTYKTTDRIVTINPAALDEETGDTVELRSGNSNGDVGTWYGFKGTTPEVVNLTTEDFTDEDRWEAINPVSRKATNFVTVLSNYLTGDFGVGYFILNDGAQATATGEKLAIAGAVDLLILSDLADARIKSGARINQKTNTGTDQDVVVQAVSHGKAVHIGGNINLPSIGADSTTFKDFGSAVKGSVVTDKTWLPKFGMNAKDGKGAVGITIMGYVGISEALATIEDGAMIHGDSLWVDAETGVLSVDFAASGGDSGKVAVNGVVTFNVIANKTIAQIENGAVIDIDSGIVFDNEDLDPAENGSLVVSAHDDSYVISLTGSVATSQSVGVGASVGVTVVDRNTQAFIGDLVGADPTTANGSIASDGNVHILAESGGFIGTLAVAGAKVSSNPAPPDNPDGDTWKNPGTGGTQGSDGTKQSNADLASWQSKMASVLTEGVEKGKIAGDIAKSVKDSVGGTQQSSSGVGISGSVAVNVVHDDTRAYILNSGPIIVGDADGVVDGLSLHAANTTTVGAIGGAGAYAKGSAGKTSVGVAGGFTINAQYGKTEAFIDHAASLELESLTIEALRRGWTVSLAAGLAAASGQKSYAVGGSVGVNVITCDTTAALMNMDGLVDVDGDVILNALDKTRIIAIGGSAGFGGKAGVGIAIGFSYVENTVSSTIFNLDDFTPAGDLDVMATSDALVISVTGSVGVATGGGGSGGYAGAGTVSINIVNNTTEAKILDTTINDATGDVTLSALDKTSIYTFAGAFAAGKKAGLGGAIAVNTLLNETAAFVENSTITTSGVFDAKAEERGTIVSLAVAGAGSQKLAIAGSIGLNLFDNDIDAHIFNSTITAGAVALTAEDREISVALGGGIAISTSSSAVGAAIGVNLIFNEVTAIVEASTLVSAATIDIDALAKEVLVSVTMGGAGGQKFALGGSVSANVVMSTVEAKVVSGVIGQDENDADIIRASDLDATGDIGISASDKTTAVVVAGGFAISLSSGAVGVAASTIYIENDILATIDGSTVTSTLGGVTLEAGVGQPDRTADPSDLSLGTTGVTMPEISSSSVVNVTFGGAGGSSFAAGFGISVNVINNTIEAGIQNGANVEAYDDVVLSAMDASVIDALAFGGAGSPSGGAAGGAISANVITNAIGTFISEATVRAGVNAAGDTLTNASADVILDSTSSSIIRALAIGASGGSSFAVSVSALGNAVANDVTAQISGSTIWAGGEVALSASDIAPSILPSWMLPEDKQETLDEKLDGSPLEPEANILAIMVSVAGSGNVAVSVSLMGNVVNNDVLANIEDSTILAGINATTRAVLNSNADVMLTSLSDAAIMAITVGVGASGNVAVQATGFGNVITNAVEASITGGSTVRSGGLVDLTAADQSQITSFGLSIAASGSAAVSAIVGANVITNSVIAQIAASTVFSGSTLDIDAATRSTIFSFTGGVAASGGAAVQVTLAANVVTNTTEASIINENIYDDDGNLVDSNASHVDAADDVTLSAEDTSSIDALAFGVSASGGGAVGVAAGANVIANTVGTAITGSSLETDGSLSLISESSSVIRALALGIAGSGGFAVQVTALGNVIANGVTASILDSIIAAMGDVRLYASDLAPSLLPAWMVPEDRADELNENLEDSPVDLEGNILAVMVSVAGSGGVAVNGAFSGNVITNTIAGTIDDSIVLAGATHADAYNSADGLDADDYAITEEGAGVVLDAKSRAAIMALTIGVAGSGAVAVNATGFGNAIANSLEAAIKGGSDVEAGGSVNLEAGDESDIRSAGVSVAGSTVAVGALIGANVITNSVAARIIGSRVKSGKEDFLADDGTTVIIPGLGVRLSAQSDAQIMGFSGGLAVGAGAGLISLTANVITNTTEAVIDGSNLDTEGAIVISAEDTSTIDALAIGVSAGAGAVGVGLGTSVITNTITTAIESSTLETDASLDLDAESASIIRTLSLGVSGGGFAVQVSAMGNAVANTVTSTILDSEVYAYGDVDLSAQDIAPSVIPEWMVGPALHSATLDPDTAVDTSADTIVVGENPWKTGDAVKYDNGGGTDINGIESGETYYIIAVDGEPTKVKLAASKDNAENGIAIDLGSSGTTGTNHQIMGLTADELNRALEDSPIDLDANILAVMVSVSGGGVAVNVGLMGNVVTNTVSTGIENSTVLAGATPSDTYDDTDLDITDFEITQWDADVTMSSLSDARIIALTAGVGVSGIVAANFTGFGNVITNSVQARIAGDATVMAGGLVDLSAEDQSSISSVGLSIAGSGGVSISGIIGYNGIANTVRAQIAGSTVETFTGGVDLAALSDADIFSFVGGVAASGMGAGQLSFAYNDIGNIIDASIVNETVEDVIRRAKVKATGNVTLSADNTSTIDAIAVGLSAAGGGAVGAAASENHIHNSVLTSISQSDVDSSYGSIGLSSESSDVVRSFAAGVAVSTFFSGQATVTINEIGNVTDARITGSTVWARGGVALSAVETAPSSVPVMLLPLAVVEELTDSLDGNTVDSGANIVSFAGSIAGSAGVSAGAAIAANTIANSIKAEIVDSTVTSVLSEVNATADSDSRIATLSAGFSAGTYAANASISTNAIANTIHADIRGASSVSAGGNINLKALDDTAIDSLTFSLAGGVVGAGGSVITNTVSNDVQAYVAGISTSAKARILRAKQISITADSTQNLEALSLGASVGLAAAGASVAWSTVDGLTKAYIGDYVDLGQTGTVDGLSVTANHHINANSEAYGLAAGIGAASINFATVDMAPEVRAYIGNDSNIKVTGDIVVASNLYATGVAEGIGVSAGGLAVGAMIAEVNLGKGNDIYEVASAVGDHTNIEAGALRISANSDDDLFADSAAGSGGVLSGAGADSRVSNDNATLVTLGNSIIDVKTLELSSIRNQDIDSRADAYTLGLLAGTGAVAKNTITGKANIDTNNTTVTAENIFITAVNRLTKQKLEADDSNLRAGSVAIGGGVTILTSGTDIGTDENPLETKITIGAGTTLTVEGVSGSSGNLIVQAYNDITAVDSVRVEAVSGLAGGAAGLSRIDAETLVDIDVDGATLENKSGDVYLTTRSSVSLYPSANLMVVSGLTGVGAADASSLINAENRVDITDATIKGEDVYIYAGRASASALSEPNFLYTIANAEIVTASLLPNITIPVLDADINETNTITITGATRVQSLEDVNLLAQEGIGGEGRARTEGVALSLSMIPYGMEVPDGADVSSTNTVSIGDNVLVEAGINNQSLVHIKPISLNGTDQPSVDTSLGTVKSRLDSLASGEHLLLTHHEKELLGLDPALKYEYAYLTAGEIPLTVSDGIIIHLVTDSFGNGIAGHYYQFELPGGGSESIVLENEDYTVTSRWTDLGASLTPEQQDAYTVYESDVTKNFKTQLDGKLYVIKPLNLDTPTISCVNVTNLLMEQRQTVIEWMISHGTDPEAVARYEVQLEALEATLVDQGLAEWIDGVLVVKKALDMLFVELPDVYASPGSVFIGADDGAQSGFAAMVGDQLNARADAGINILNKSPLLMAVNDAMVKDNRRIAVSGDELVVLTPGNVYFNNMSLSNLDMGIDGLAPVSGQTRVYKAGHDFAAGDAVRFEGITQSGWNALSGVYEVKSVSGDYFTIDFDATGYETYTPDFDLGTVTRVKEITILQDAYLESDYDLGGLDIPDVPQDLYILGRVINENGDLTIENLEGGVNVSGEIRAENVTIRAQGDFNLSTEDWLHTNRDPRQYVDYTALRNLVFDNITGAYDYEVFNDTDGIPGPDGNLSALALENAINNDYSSIVAQGRINITARYLNINGLVQSGTDHVTLDISEDFNPGAYTTSLLDDDGNPLPGISFGAHNIPVDGYYDAAQQAIVVEDIVPTGGSITLAGQIFSTGNGTLRVANGYTDVTIDNQSDYDLVLGRIDVTTFREGEIIIINTAALVKVEYRVAGDQIEETTYTGVFVPATASDISRIDYTAIAYDDYHFGETITYYPTIGLQYVWTEGQEKSHVEVYHYEQKSFNLLGFDWDALAADDSWTDMDIYDRDETPLLESEFVDLSSSGNVPWYAADSAYSVEFYRVPDKIIDLTPDSTIVKWTDTTLDGVTPDNAFYRYIGPSGAEAELSTIDYATASTGDNPTWEQIKDSGTLLTLNAQVANKTFQDPAKDQYYSDFENVTVDEFHDEWGGGWMREKTYYTRITTTTGIKDYFTHTLKADYPVDIEFIQGPISPEITITSGGDIRLQGELAVPHDLGVTPKIEGKITLTADGDIIQTETSAIFGANPTMTAGGSVYFNLQGGQGGNPTGLNITSDKDIEVILVSEDQTSSIIVDQVISIGGNVTLHAPDGVFALDADSLIKGNRIEIYSKRGFVGTAALPIEIDSAAFGMGGLAVRAEGDIYITEIDGDLNLIEPETFPESVEVEASIHSISGDVYLETVDGSIYDAFLELFRPSESIDIENLDPRVQELITAGTFTLDALMYPLSPDLYKTLYPHAEFLGSRIPMSATESPNIIGNNVTIIAGGSTGEIGHVSDMMSIDMTGNFAALSTPEKEVLSIATAADIIGIGYALYEYIGSGLSDVYFTLTKGTLVKNLSDNIVYRYVGEATLFDLSGVDYAQSDKWEATDIDPETYLRDPDSGRFQSDDQDAAFFSGTSWRRIDVDHATGSDPTVPVTVSIVSGDTVLVQLNADSYGLYRYTGSARSMDLVQQDYSNGTVWERLTTERGQRADHATDDDGAVDLSTGDLVLNKFEMENLTLQLWDDVDVDAIDESDPSGYGAFSAASGAGMALQTMGGFNIDSIRAGGNVRLQAHGSITDLNTDSTAAIGGFGDLILLSETGSIGSEADPLRIQLSDSSRLSAQAAGDIVINQVGGSLTIYGETQTIDDLRIAQIDAGGIVQIKVLDGDMYVGKVSSDTYIDLQAPNGSLLDIFDDEDLPSSNVVTPIIGNVYLHSGASGTIGTADNFLEIWIIDGELTSYSIGDTFIHSFGDLYVENMTSTDGDITVQVDGDAFIDRINAEKGIVTLNVDGAIVDYCNDVQGADTDADIDIHALGAVLNADDGVADALKRLETQISNLEANTGTGGIWLDNTGDLIIGGISDQVGIVAGTTVDISAASSITVSEAIDSAAGPVLLDATDDIHVHAPITSGGGTVTLLADRDITFNASGSIDTESGGATVTVRADNDKSGGGAITMADGSYVDATDGFIDMDATGDISLSHLRTTTQVDIDASAGSILDSGDSHLEIVASKAQLQAYGNIGLNANALEAGVAYLEAESSTGGIYLDDRNGLIVGQIGLVGDPVLNTAINGLRAQQTIRVTTTGFMRVREDVESTTADITLQAIDSAAMTLLPHPDGGTTVSALDGSDSDEDLLVEYNADIMAATSVTLLAGDDMLIDAGSTITTDEDGTTAVTDSITLRIDHGDADDNTGVDADGNGYHTGARFDLLGSISTTSLLITGEHDDDTFYLHPESLSGHTRVLGDIGDAAGGTDWFVLDHLPSITGTHDRPGHLLTDGSDGAVLDTIDLDGCGGTDHYVVNIGAGGTAYLVNVQDSGAPNDGSDTLRMHTLDAVGTDAFDWNHPQESGTDPGTNDVFLLRRNFVAYLTPNPVYDPDDADSNEFLTPVQRINYDTSINGRLMVSAGDGDDRFYVDDNSAITTLDGGLGRDLFQIGQVFGTNPNGYDYPEGDRPDDIRTVADDTQNIDLTADSDDMELLRITRGWLSQGITHALTAFGGEGGNTFNVYSNKAVLRMEGESGI